METLAWRCTANWNSFLVWAFARTVAVTTNTKANLLILLLLSITAVSKRHPHFDPGSINPEVIAVSVPSPSRKPSPSARRHSSSTAVQFHRSDCHAPKPRRHEHKHLRREDQSRMPSACSDRPTPLP